MQALIAYSPLIAFVVFVISLEIYLSIDREDDTGNCANPPPTRWRQHLDKPPHLPFRPTRFDRHPGNSSRAQQC